MVPQLCAQGAVLNIAIVAVLIERSILARGVAEQKLILQQNRCFIKNGTLRKMGCVGVKATNVFSVGYVQFSSLEHPLHGLSRATRMCEASSVIARNIRKPSLAWRHTKCGEPSTLWKESTFVS